MLLREGFTLVELAIIVFILSSVFLIALPRFKNVFPQTYLSSSARRIAGEINRLYHEAGFTGRRCSLGFSIGTGQYWMSKEMSGGSMERLDGGPRKLLPGVSFQDVVVAGRKVDEGEPEINFSPIGMVEPSVIHLVNSDGEQLSIVVHSFTGRVELCDGYRELRIKN